MTTNSKTQSAAIEIKPNPDAEVERIELDFSEGTVSIQRNSKTETFALNTPQGFHAMSVAWLRAAWDAKYMHSFTWFGRPFIQIPDDAMRMQELIYALKPDVIVETGIAHGGSLVFYAALCKAMGKGRVIGVDIEIRPHNRKAIEEHELFSYITLIEGDSASEEIVQQIQRHIKAADTVLIVLDSCHSKDHVTKELECYAPLVSKGSYIVAMDGIMEQVCGASRTNNDWSWNNPRRAALEFVQKHPEFKILPPAFNFNEGAAENWVTFSPSGILQRVK